MIYKFTNISDRTDERNGCCDAWRGSQDIEMWLEIWTKVQDVLCESLA
jgi:hypothetical protein